jgi:hypothetical protein
MEQDSLSRHEVLKAHSFVPVIKVDEFIQLPAKLDVLGTRMR